MDELFEFIGWAIVVFFFLLGGRKNKKKQQKPRPADTGDGEARPQTLEEALREIREALAEGQGKKQPADSERPPILVEERVRVEPKRPPRAAPTPDQVRARSTRPKRPPRPVPKPRPLRSAETEFKSPVEAQDSISAREREFTRKARFRGDEFIDLERSEVSAGGHPHRSGLLTSSKPPAGPPPSGAATRRMLRKMNPEALRQGLILSEVLGPPRALRPHDPRNRSA